MRTRYLVVGAIVLVGAAAAASSVAARPDVKPGQADPPAEMLEQARPELMLGTGEQLVIVVNGRFGNEQAAAQAGARLAFGELQGFYVDRAANYRLLGYYEQTSPDRQTVECLAPVDPTGGTCPDRQRSWIAIPAVQLVYHPLDRAGPVQDPEPCGIINAPPCMAERVSQLLATAADGTLGDGVFLLSAFRTKAGAAAFMELARSAGATDLVALRVIKLGGPYVGLGQEPHPDGSGPLLGPLPDPGAYQD